MINEMEPFKTAVIVSPQYFSMCISFYLNVCVFYCFQFGLVCFQPAFICDRCLCFLYCVCVYVYVYACVCECVNISSSTYLDQPVRHTTRPAKSRRAKVAFPIFAGEGEAQEADTRRRENLALLVASSLSPARYIWHWGRAHRCSSIS